MDLLIQNIIEKVMANPWILIIIIGLAVNTFKRFASGEKEPTPQVPLPKQFNPFDQEPKPVKEVQQAESKYEFEPKEVPETSVSNTFYERYQELQQKGTYSETTTQDEGQPVLEVIKPRAAASGQTGVKSFSKNKVVEGIIWSEILGPPRAKKPYQIRR
ncbi:hypothetical protein [Bacillus sp. REN16]|uniref:hypothetical protein n=1 Tax=Bacillus sp. REN16 TaxID=2887296 RepID=UPI001E3E85B7|nr:hypothetical protein [Bacillus sp. REN16]MCC3356675.1 hypothetical protein [Bacillus sp. REN16]